jgi:hypothetical protein
LAALIERKTVKRTMPALVAVLAVVLLGAAGCDITPGGSCSAEGSKHTNKNGYAYTCKPITGQDGKPRNIWQQDAPLTPDRP